MERGDNQEKKNYSVQQSTIAHLDSRGNTSDWYHGWYSARRCYFWRLNCGQRRAHLCFCVPAERTHKFPTNTSNKINDIATEKGHTTLPEHISTTYKHFSNLKSPIVICGDMAKYLREGKKIEVHVPCASYICILLIFLQKIGPLCFIKMQMAHPCEEICWLREAKSV